MCFMIKWRRLIYSFPFGWMNITCERIRYGRAHYNMIVAYSFVDVGERVMFASYMFHIEMWTIILHLLMINIVILRLKLSLLSIVVSFHFYVLICTFALVIYIFVVLTLAQRNAYNRHRNLGNVVDHAGIELKMFGLRQHHQLPVVQHVRSTLLGLPKYSFNGRKSVYDIKPRFKL